MTDEDLAECAKHGDREAVGELYNRLIPYFLKIASQFGNKIDRDSVAHDAFLLVWRNIDTYHGPRLLPWARRIAYHRCCDEIIKESKPIRAKRYKLPYDLIDGGHGPLEYLIAKDYHRIIESEMVKVQWSVPRAYFIKGLKLREIADRHGMPLGTVKSVIHQFRRRVSELLHGDSDNGAQV